MGYGGRRPAGQGAIGAVVARFVHTEEVTGSNPVSPTPIKPLSLGITRDKRRSTDPPNPLLCRSRGVWNGMRDADGQPRLRILAVRTRSTCNVVSSGSPRRLRPPPGDRHHAPGRPPPRPSLLPSIWRPESTPR